MLQTCKLKNVGQRKLNKYNEVILNLAVDLPYKLFCQKRLNNKNQRLTWKIPNQVWNDFYNITVRGFTLIELLVVVLIIGILAAVAIPQYQKAVLKSRLTEYETTLKSLHQTARICKLGKGSECTIDELDIEIPTCKKWPGTNFCKYGIESGGYSPAGVYVKFSEDGADMLLFSTSIDKLVCRGFYKLPCNHLGFTKHETMGLYSRP